MKLNSIQITDSDVQRLRRMLEQALQEGDVTSAEATKLRTELDRAKIVDPHLIPAAVVTMNSTIDLLDLETGEEETYTLVFPEDADPAEGKVSVLAPIGTAVLGYRVGDVFKWEVPSGTRQLEIKSIIYQPQASGDFHL
ncbi:MAG: nucleoside diphosphate kinase regulator [Verrucomicrobiota bacterium]